jgi:hypothetical protein
MLCRTAQRMTDVRMWPYPKVFEIDADFWS